MSETAAKEYFTVDELCSVFGGVSRQKVLALLKSEGFPKMKIGRTWMIPIKEFREWQKNNLNKEINLEIGG